MVNSIRFLVIIPCLVALSGSAQQKPLFDVSKNYDEDGKATYEEVSKLILENYYYDGLTANDLYWASIEGMLRHISPPESPDLAKLWTEEEYEEILNSLKGINVSLGFSSSFNTLDGSLTVTNIIKDSEAEGLLKTQDRIVRIDDQGMVGLTVADVNKLLDGEVGESATLKVIRDIEIFDVTLTRDTLKTQNMVVSKIPNSRMALVELKSFPVGIADDLEKALSDLALDGIGSIILDLRNNGGGVLNEGILVSKLFMKKGDIVLRTQSRSNGVINYTATEDKFTNLGLAVLINENTASASEIVASALQDHGRALIIGKKSFGKSVIENTYSLQNNYRVKFITNSMYTPKGVSWQSNGILPDFFIDQSQNSYQKVANTAINDRLKNDLHLSTAVRLLK